MFEEAIGNATSPVMTRMPKRKLKEVIINRGHWVDPKLLPIINAVAAIVDGSGKGALFIVVEGDTVKMWCREGITDRRGEPTTKPIETATGPGCYAITELDYYSSGEL